MFREPPFDFYWEGDKEVAIYPDLFLPKFGFWIFFKRTCAPDFFSKNISKLTFFVILSDPRFFYSTLGSCIFYQQKLGSWFFSLRLLLCLPPPTNQITNTTICICHQIWYSLSSSLQNWTTYIFPWFVRFKGVGPLSGVFGPYLKTYNLVFLHKRTLLFYVMYLIFT